MFRSIALLNKGKVDKWIAHKGFGFIVEEGTNKSFFVHNQGLKVPEGAFRALSVGQEVEFDVVREGDREKAINVTAVGGGLLPEGPRPPQRQFDDRPPRQQGGRGGFNGGRGGYNNGGRGGYNNGGQRYENNENQY
ncbi:RNA-binding protein Rpb16, putative [Bodo saltans]|uniref:RNA-binding protein Rpb16, putative n=1 Tax=Bodo saltans TaxID=75058 RepID=A0A0S4ISC2_BODSA|nr:RNA-binding protein Rpb16, putative [Bodo saltans]|eukprot:CUE98814.1 RNA-binding protein Rpb16, putative [Bodo saltans]